MYDLTQRQIEILKQIIKEYVDTAEPVGSETLEKKYDLGVSPATIRNEMAEMVKNGYLSKPHTSAGRVPTSKAMRFYVNELMREKELSVSEEVETKEKVWDLREQEEKFLREATKILSQKTKSFAVATTREGDIYFAGYSNILEMPEFFDIDVTKNFLNVLDNISYFDSIMERLEEGCSVFLGDDLEEDLRLYSFIFSPFETKKHHFGTIGVFGPTRVKYEQIVPTVKYFGNLVQEIAGW